MPSLLELAHLRNFLKTQVKDGISESLLEQSQTRVAPNRHGDLPGWLKLIGALPDVSAEHIGLGGSAVTVGEGGALEDGQQALKDALEGLRPWRKGPFNVFGTEIDAEWRSDMKWDRLAEHLDFEKKRVLDVGAGNGYHCFRAAGAGARMALGIDPTLLYVAQFTAIKRFLPKLPVALLPLALEELPAALTNFDIVLSMGVLYHRRSPLDHLMHLKRHLKVGGQVVIETIVMDGPPGFSLVPDDRYASMPNVWFIPAAETVCQWLTRVGFKRPSVVNITPTTEQEQRTTEWMPSKSFKDFLDPSDPAKTLEGYPSPKRAVIIASR